MISPMWHAEKENYADSKRNSGFQELGRDNDE